MAVCPLGSLQNRPKTNMVPLPPAAAAGSATTSSRRPGPGLPGLWAGAAWRPRKSVSGLVPEGGRD